MESAPSTPISGPGGDGGRDRRPTSADVARATGLSRATVSYVLNNTPHQVIPEPTRARVLEAAAALGYTPSAAARALRSGRSDVVLYLLPDWPIGTQVGMLLQSLSSALAALDLTLLVHPRSPEDRPIAELWRSITPAAVLTTEDLAEADRAGLRNAGIGLTVALSGRPGPDGPLLHGLEERTGRLQVEHLAAAGHRRLGYAYPADGRVAAFAEPRLAGVRRACADLGLAEPIVRATGLDPAGTAAAVADWRAAGPVVSGICAYNDEIALGVLAAARAANLVVPDDLAVVGVDDVPAAAVAVPPLTTVAGDVPAAAQYLADTIAAGLSGRPRPPEPASDHHRVVVRRSA